MNKIIGVVGYNAQQNGRIVSPAHLSLTHLPSCLARLKIEPKVSSGIGLQHERKHGETQSFI